MLEPREIDERWEHVIREINDMADDLKDRGARDCSRVNIHEDYEVRYWTEKWGVTKERLAQAVQKVGVSSEAVARELGKNP